MFARTERLTLRPGWIEDASALTRAIAHECVVTKLARLPWPYDLLDAETYLTMPVARDEAPGKANPAKIPELRAAFAKEGTITAATSSSISDGAAAVVLTRQSTAQAHGKQPIARIVAMAAHAQEPKDFTTAPVGAIQKVLKQAGWSAQDVDLWEVNEAFACVAMFAMRDIGIPHDKINVNGGAIALGHPLGASGTKLMATLLNALEQRGGRYGLQTMCEGGGMANVTIVERL